MNTATLTVLLGRQFRALRASWATWALAAAAALFATTAPVTARYLPDILGGLVGGGPLPIDVSALPEPVPADAWAQWSSNLAQIVIVIVSIVAASAISADVTRGTVVPLLSRRISRAGLWTTAFAAVTATVAAVTVVATAAMVAVTALLFDGLATSDIRLVAAGSALWLLFAVSAIAVTMAASGAGASSLGAAATGIAYFGLMAVAGMWPAMKYWSPAGLLAAADGTAGVGAIAGTAAVAGVAVAVGLTAFNRREL